ncbi:MAG: single-stranded DNA-binding protein [Cyanobium sp. 49614_E6]|jgi:single-strand DNA-binding protein|nr:single-stranded DNA-binding protein [Cyanobium sp. 49614_E6]
MSSLNVCTFTGRAGRDPEVRYFESGKMVAEFSIAVDGWKRDEKPLWLNLKIWGKIADVAANYVRKGSMIAVSGKLENETWTDRGSGEERSKIVLNVKDLTLLDSKKDSDASGFGGSVADHVDDLDDDIPF